MTKLLVIGSKGFIGSHVYSYFKQLNNTDCWACDVISDYVDKKYLPVDASNADFNEIFEAHKFHFCINCSGASSVPDSIINPFRDFALNVYNVIKILEAIRKRATECRFVNLSSAAVYGNPQRLPVSEKDACLPVSPYGKHKLYAEGVCKEYYELFNLQNCSLRIFSAYGPGLKKQLLWDIFQKAINSDFISLFGTGQETRDFIFIKDIVQAISVIITKGNFSAGIYNVAGGIQVTVKQIAKLMLDALNINKEIVFSECNRIGDPLAWQADVTELKYLGFNTNISIDEGIQKYIEWLRGEKLV